MRRPSFLAGSTRSSSRRDSLWSESEGSSRRDSFYAEPTHGANNSWRFASTVYQESYGSIAKSVVHSDSESDISTESLWHQNNAAGAVIFVVRRSGCPLCRLQALLIAHCRPIFHQLGFATVAIVSCDNPDNVEFSKRYWGDRVYADRDQTFYRLLGGGILTRSEGAKDALSLAFIGRIVRSLCINQVRPSLAFLNDTGQPILGGSILVLPDKGIVFMQRELSLGNFGDLARLIRSAYRHSPNKGLVTVDEVEDAIRQHRRRMNGRLRRLPSII